MGAEGCAAIANNPTWSNLNEIKNEGARELGKNYFWTKLAGLHLSSNQISDAGVRFMAANKKWINLKHLDLSRNLIGYKESLVLWGNAYWKKLEEIELSHNTGMRTEERNALKSNPLFGSKISFSRKRYN